MTKSSVADWDTTAANNTDVGGVVLGEGSMPMSKVNDAIRTVMAQIATAQFLSGAAAALSDAAFSIHDDGDATKIWKVQISGLTTGTTRTVTMPDASGALVLDTATQTLTNKTLTAPTLTLKQSSTPAPTAEGDIQWDTDDNVVAIGDGAATQLFLPIPASTAAGDIEYFTGAKVKARLAKGTAGQVLTMNAGATAPEWDTPSVAGHVLLATMTPSGSPSTLTSANFVSTPYSSLEIVFDAFSVNNSSATTLNISSDNGVSFDTAVAVFPAGGLTYVGGMTLSRVGVVANKVLTSSNIVSLDSFIRFTTKTSPTTNIRLAGPAFTGGVVYIYGVP